MRPTFARIVAWQFVLLIGSTLTAQDEREPFDASGTLRAVAGGAVQVATKDNELVPVKLPMKPADITYTANAEQSFLRPGMTVKFSGTLNKRGQLAEPITSLTVFTPLESDDIGVYPENVGVASNPLGGIFNDNKPEEQPKKKPAKISLEDVSYRIAGTIASLKSGRMVVAAGSMQIKCELADDAKIKVSLANLSYAQVGDKVEIEGWRYKAMKQAGAIANRITVTAANALEGEKKVRAATKADEKSTEKERPADEKPVGKQSDHTNVRAF